MPISCYALGKPTKTISRTVGKRKIKLPVEKNQLLSNKGKTQGPLTVWTCTDVSPHPHCSVVLLDLRGRDNLHLNESYEFIGLVTYCGIKLKINQAVQAISYRVQPLGTMKVTHPVVMWILNY